VGGGPAQRDFDVREKRGGGPHFSAERKNLVPGGRFFPNHVLGGSFFFFRNENIHPRNNQKKPSWKSGPGGFLGWGLVKGPRARGAGPGASKKVWVPGRGGDNGNRPKSNLYCVLFFPRGGGAPPLFVKNRSQKNTNSPNFSRWAVSRVRHGGGGGTKKFSVRSRTQKNNRRTPTPARFLVSGAFAKTRAGFFPIGGEGEGGLFCGQREKKKKTASTKKKNPNWGTGTRGFSSGKKWGGGDPTGRGAWGGFFAVWGGGRRL